MRPFLAPAAGLALTAAMIAGATAQPLQLPGAQPFNPAGTTHGAAVERPRAPAMPALRVAGEEAVLGRTLRRNGSSGEARLAKTGAGYGLRLSVRGYQSASSQAGNSHTGNPTEPCIVDFGEQPVAVTAQGRPAGVPRYRLEAPVCPLVFDVLDGALLVLEPHEPCLIEAAACRIDARGLWGPDSRTIAGEARAIESARAAAERAVREGYRALTARADPIDQRDLAREQASFSAERAQICRDYEQEGRLGFCGARITEARAAAIRARPGLAEPKPAAAQRPRRPAQPRPAPGPVPLSPGPLRQ